LESGALSASLVAMTPIPPDHGRLPSGPPMEPKYAAAIRQKYKCECSRLSQLDVRVKVPKDPDLRRRVVRVAVHFPEKDVECFAWMEPGRADPVLVLQGKWVVSAEDAVLAFYTGNLPRDDD
jgi:hypothetical protein